MKAEAFASAHVWALWLLILLVLAAMKAEAFASAHCHRLDSAAAPMMVSRNEGGGFRLRALRSRGVPLHRSSLAAMKAEAFASAHRFPGDG